MARWRMDSLETHELWARRQGGATYEALGRAFGLTREAIFQVVRARGGVPPRPRRRAAWTLTCTEREEISRGIATGQSYAAIARQLHRPTSTIAREVHRHGGRAQYRSAAADRRAWARARRPKPCRLATAPALRHAVTARLADDWSPRQIAAWLRRQYPDNPAMHVSHETIYLSLFVQARGGLKRDLVRHLRRGQRLRHPRGRRRWAVEHIPDLVSIRERPASVEDRAVPGHWEGDLLSGKGHSKIATLVERQSRYVMLVRLPRADSPSVVHALAQRIRTLPAHLRQSLTWDRGRELAAHRAFTVATNVRVYFCDPRSPWQRGSNENTNGLLRQYLPKGTDVSRFTQAQLNAIARRLNTRPRQTLGWDTPAAKLAACVAPTD